MAADYWTSTQRTYWTFTPEKLSSIRDDLERANAKTIEQFPFPDRRLMFIFLRDRLVQLGKRLPFRQQCMATALVYLHRYFLSTPMQNVNIYLLVATAFYLSSKTEESPHHIRLVAAEARQAWPELMPGDVFRLGEMEFCLISEMRSQLIVWHPYRTLIALKENQDLRLTNDELGLAWSIINDSYMTDLPLTCPPHLIAIIAMLLAVVFLPTAKASGTLRPISHESLVNPDSSAGPFSSLVGRNGQNLSSSFSAAVGNLQMSNNNQQFGQHSVNNNQGKSRAAQESSATDRDKDKTIVAAIKDSEKLQNIITFLVESGIDVEQVINGVQEMISLYSVWEEYNEKTVREAVARCIKGRGLDG
ncbi:RNA polymerase II holoenzyme cyclin-like subunit [Exophiala dermatitidis]